jgi:antitoxin ParD1/3/4
MNISFTEKQEKYIRDHVASGNYKNASEVVREAMRLHQEVQDRKLEWLRAEVKKGRDAHSSSRNVLDILADKLAEYKVNA